MDSLVPEKAKARAFTIMQATVLQNYFIYE